MKPKTDIRPVLKPGALYLGDNGRCFCTEHAGMTALYTGRDLSGQKVPEVTAADHAYAKTEGWAIKCERCR